jgi:Fic family protein
MQLTKKISQIDRFDASWTTIEKREGKTLKQLKSIATVRSVGASTRIEGSRMTDTEVEVLIKNLTSSKLEERDQQEVAGYFETLELIADSFKNMEITESNLKHLHNLLMKYGEKDAWHKGNYKQHSNIVEATNLDGSKQVIFQTTEPGLATEQAMSKLVEWYNTDRQTHILIKAAVFINDFLSIHPFQDGNGRLSRLLGTLLLMKSGYSWIQYVSFEHEIENKKSEYYRILMQCQRQRPGEDVNSWVLFFLDCLKNIQHQLLTKLEFHTKSDKLSIREKMIYSFVENHPGSKSSDIAKKIDIPLPSVKRLLAEMVKSKLLVIHGAGAGTSYTIEGNATIQKDLAMRFTNNERKKNSY